MKTLFILMISLFFISASSGEKDMEEEFNRLEKCVSKYCTYEMYTECLVENAPLTCMKELKSCVTDALGLCKTEEK